MWVSSRMSRSRSRRTSWIRHRLESWTGRAPSCARCRADSRNTSRRVTSRCWRRRGRFRLAGGPGYSSRSGPTGDTIPMLGRARCRVRSAARHCARAGRTPPGRRARVAPACPGDPTQRRSRVPMEDQAGGTAGPRLVEVEEFKPVQVIDPTGVDVDLFDPAPLAGRRQLGSVLLRDKSHRRGLTRRRSWRRPRRGWPSAARLRATARIRVSLSPIWKPLGRIDGSA